IEGFDVDLEGDGGPPQISAPAGTVTIVARTLEAEDLYVDVSADKLAGSPTAGTVRLEIGESALLGNSNIDARGFDVANAGTMEMVGPDASIVLEETTIAADNSGTYLTPTQSDGGTIHIDVGSLELDRSLISTLTEGYFIILGRAGGIDIRARDFVEILG